MTMKRALPLLALLLSACAQVPGAAADPRAGGQRQCPAYPLPPADLLKPPAKTDFLPTDALTATEQAIQLDELIKWVRQQQLIRTLRNTDRHCERSELRLTAVAGLHRRLRSCNDDRGGPPMKPDRLNALTDGVVAIVLTIMVLELKFPAEPTLRAVLAVLPLLAAYLLAFIYVAIYWNNHHHMMQSARTMTGAVLWANHRCSSA